MTNRIELYAGTAGHSVWFSEDLGQRWVHPNSHSGLYMASRVWSFSSHPARPGVLYAGTDMGLYRWDEATARWTAMPSPMENIWALAQSPDDPDLIYAGTLPAALYRSEDGGASWTQASEENMPGFSAVNNGFTRVTQILPDPIDNDLVWAVVEIGGVYLSRDRGRNWAPKNQGLASQDMHGIASLRGPDGRRILLATTNYGLHRSDDDGETWVLQRLDSPWQYTRSVVPRADTDRIVFLTNGDGPPGYDGRLMRSDDYGATWRTLPLPGRLNSTVWCVATHPSDPLFILACSNLGQLFRSTDGGDTWERMQHEFGDVRALHWRMADIPDGRPAHSLTVRRQL